VHIDEESAILRMDFPAFSGKYIQRAVIKTANKKHRFGASFT